MASLSFKAFLLLALFGACALVLTPVSALRHMVDHDEDLEDVVEHTLEQDEEDEDDLDGVFSEDAEEEDLGGSSTCDEAPKLTFTSWDTGSHAKYTCASPNRQGCH